MKNDYDLYCFILNLMKIKKDEDIIQKLLNHIGLNKTVYERAETFISDFGM